MFVFQPNGGNDVVVDFQDDLDGWISAPSTSPTRPTSSTSRHKPAPASCSTCPAGRPSN
jgi:hypothetical protein